MEEVEIKVGTMTRDGKTTMVSATLSQTGDVRIFVYTFPDKGRGAGESLMLDQAGFSELVQLLAKARDAAERLSAIQLPIPGKPPRLPWR